MLFACWSAKGGSGTTVVAAALATVLSRRSPDGAVIADLAGDVPAVLGLPDPPGPGLVQWLEAGPDVPADSLARLEASGPPGLAVLPAGGPLPPTSSGRAEVLAAALAVDPRPVVIDCGVIGPTGPPDAVAVAAVASLSLLVLRPCILSLRRAQAAPLRPSGVVLVAEPGASSLVAADVEDALGVPVRAVVALDPAVARAVERGLLARRLPRSLDKALRRAA